MSNAGKSRLFRTDTPLNDSALVMDFDGVLSLIASNPESSQPLAGVTDTLLGLSRHLGVVALLSGRSASFLKERFPQPELLKFGSYGLERVIESGDVEVSDEAVKWLPVLDDAESWLRDHLEGAAGYHLERKSHGLGIHWRDCPDQASAEGYAEQLAEELARTRNLMVVPGKAVLEIRAPLVADKGTALRTLVKDRNVKHVVYAGDDHGDLPAFAVAQDLGGQCVVVTGDDMDAHVSVVEGLHLDGPPAFLEELQALLSDVRGNTRA